MVTEMKKTILLASLLLSGCAAMQSDYMNRSQLCDLERTANGETASFRDSALIQDYPEQGYFVYQLNGTQKGFQSPNLVNGKGSFDGVDYTSGAGFYLIENRKSGSIIKIKSCKKAFK